MQAVAAASALLLFGLVSCDAASTGTLSGEALVDRLDITLNPSGYVPLAAEAHLTTQEPVQVEVFVPGRTAVGDVRRRFETVDAEHTLPILGLYSDTDNPVTFRFFGAGGVSRGEVLRTVKTDPPIAGLPEVTIQVQRPRAKPGMNLVNYFGATGELLPMTPVFVDAAGDVRWYAAFERHEVLGRLFYDVGPERLANGDLFFGDGNSGRIVSLDMLGNITGTWPIPGYGFHHHVMEMTPDGNLLATVNKRGIATVEDHIIEIDRESAAIVQEWDLRQSLDAGRRTWSDNTRDWFHANGLAYDAAQDAIIVSGRVQGVVKLTRDNALVWILAPHVDWGMAGNYVDLSSKLLTPLDRNGNPIADPSVLEGRQAHEDFDWAWYPHAPELLPNGDLLLFDNGDNRHFQQGERYSRAVVYRIDESAMTVQQVWEYGRTRGNATYSRIVSDVDYHADEGTIVFMPGSAHDGTGPLGRVIEVDQSTGEVLLEFTVRAPNAPWGITFHRVERLPLYPVAAQ